MEQRESIVQQCIPAEYSPHSPNRCPKLCIPVSFPPLITSLRAALLKFSTVLKDSPNLCGGFLVWLTKGARTWTGGRYLSCTWDVNELEAMKEEIVSGDKLKLRMVV